MTSHARYPSVDPDSPATLSPIINSTWLRERLGFGGILFSDDLDMAAISENYPPPEVVSRALSCGTDFLLLCQNSDNIEPFSRALASQIANQAHLHEAHKKSVERITDIFRFHFAGAFL